MPKRIVKTYTKSRVGEQQRNVAYWQTRSYEERLAALEQIRREYHLWKYGAEPGFQGVCATVIRHRILASRIPEIPAEC